MVHAHSALTNTSTVRKPSAIDANAVRATCSSLFPDTARVVSKGVDSACCSTGVIMGVGGSSGHC